MHLIKEIPNSSKNMVQKMEIIKEHNSNDDYRKDMNSLLIDLDGLDDWLNFNNKANPKNIISQDLLNVDFNQWEQSWYQTGANKAKNGTSNMNDKVNNIETLIIYRFFE